jgi:hypothetical protein
LIRDKEIIEKVEYLRSLYLRLNSHLYSRYPNCTIGEASSIEAKSYGRNQKERPAIAIIEVVLSINRKYVTHVEPHIKRIEKTRLSTFNELEYIVNRLSMKEFFSFWGPHDTRKYQIVKDLLEAINVLKDKYKINDDYLVMNKWALEVNIDKYEKDIIGRIKNVGLATFQHLRMNFGINTVKPDRQVKNVLEREFGFKGNDKKAIIAVEAISKISGYSPIELDQIFVNYGSGYYETKKEEKKISFACRNK